MPWPTRRTASRCRCLLAATSSSRLVSAGLWTGKRLRISSRRWRSTAYLVPRFHCRTTWTTKARVTSVKSRRCSPGNVAPSFSWLRRIGSSTGPRSRSGNGSSIRWVPGDFRLAWWGASVRSRSPSSRKPVSLVATARRDLFRVRPWQVAAATLSIAILYVFAQSQVSALRSGRPLVREFMAFYTVGYVLNQSPGILYDPKAFNETYHSLFPALPDEAKQLYAHAPFEAIAFRPFALLPFESSLVAWQVLSVVLFSLGFTLVWRASDSLPCGQ